MSESSTVSLDEDYKKVEIWLSKRGWHVFTYTDAYDATFWLLKEIHINSRNHAKRRLYTLLHECGHVLVDDNRDRIHRLSRECHHLAGSRIRSKRKRIALVSEEYEAWKRGERLARRLKIRIDTDKFDTFRAESLMSYVNCASDFFLHAK